MELFDTHAHLEDDQLDAIREQVLQRARAAGVTRILAVGTTVASSRACLELAQGHAGIYAAVGIHPNHCQQAAEGDWQAIVELCHQSRVVALGETGLDRYWDYAPFELQQDYFERHLRLSQETDLPFIVHMRDCGPEIVAMLEAAKRHGPLRGVMHSFTGDLSLAQHCLDLGLHISFAGMLTFKKSDELRSVAARIPADRLLIETDSPYLSPHPHRGRRPNEPALIVHTARCLAELRGVPLEELARQTTCNALRLFSRIGASLP